MYGAYMAMLWRSIIGFWFHWSNSWPQPQKNLMIDPIHQTFRICCWPQCQCGFSFSFLLFLLWWKFLFFSFAWIWITDPKPILPSEYISLWDFYAGWIPFIAFILEESLNIYADLLVISLCACCFSRGGRIMIMVLLREVGVCFLSQPP